MCCYPPSVDRIQNPVTFRVVKLPVLCAADFQQLGANLASQWKLANDALKLSENVCDNRAWLNINTAQETRYCADAVLYRKRVLKGHLLFHCNPLMLSTVMLKVHPTAVPLRTRTLPLYPSLTASAISAEQWRSLAPAAAHRILSRRREPHFA